MEKPGGPTADPDGHAESTSDLELKSFREAVDHAGHSIYITDTNAEIQYVNSAFEQTTGYSAEEAIGRTPRILKSGAHDQEFYQKLWGTILSGDVWENELVNRRKDGTQYIANQTIAPIDDGTGTIVRFVAVNTDVTEQRRRRQQLQALYKATTEWLDARTSEEVCEIVSTQLIDLLQFDRHGLYLYDESDHCLELAKMSPKAEQTLEGRTVVRAGDGVVWDVFETGERNQSGTVDSDTTVFSADSAVRSELVLPLGDNGVLLLGSEQAAAFDGSDETILRVLASGLTEVLNRIERERELQEQNSRLEGFASVVSHDLRNPLNVAQGHVELAAETGDIAHLDPAMQAHERMGKIIDDLLWLAREGRGIGETRSVNFSRVVEDAWAHVDTADATLRAECEHTIEADPDRLQQLFENLFRNAIEHGGEDVTVRVGLLADGFYVEDDGPGISEDDREHVLSTGYSTRPEGTGYGLAIVESIAEAHDCQLDLTEGAEGGARFEIRQREQD